MGGPAQHCLELARLDDEFPSLLVAGTVAAGEEDIAHEFRARGIGVHTVPELGRSLRPWDDVAALSKLVALLRRLRPQLVETHCSKAGALGRIAARIAGVPVRVHTMHALVFDDFPPLAGRTFALAERALATLTTRIVAINEWQADALAMRFRVCSRDRIAVINIGRELDGIAAVSDADRAAFREEVGAGGRPVVTIVARLVPVKNQALLLHAAARLRADGHRVVYALVGGGPDDARLRALALELGVADDVRFLGVRRDLERVYAGSDVVVLTSDNEAMGFCLIEALAARVPVIATAVGGVPDLLEGGRLGRLVPPGDAAQLAAAIERTIAAGDAARPTVDQSAAVRRRYGTERLLDETRTLYRQLLDGIDT